MVGAFCVQRYHTGGGLAMLWFDQVDVVVSTYSRNHIDARVVKKSSGTGFHVTGFSGNPETHKRKESWALLKHLSSLSSEPWICMGDFNEILDNNERSGRCSRPGWPIEDFRVVVVHIVNFMIWDHCPMVLSLPDSQSTRKRKQVFRFKAMWTMEEECKEVIANAWNSEVVEGRPMFQVVEKLKGCRGSLIAWNIRLLQDELNVLLEKEEVYWRQRSRVAWMKEGDKNTKFFHAQCNEQRQQNCIKGLRDGQGVWQTEKSRIADVAVEYFQNIFTSTTPQMSLISTCLEGMERVIDEDMNNLLLEDFTSSENYWDIVGLEVTHAVLSILQSSYMFRRLIIDNVRVAFEVMHSMSLKRRGQMAIKLDMSKAYDWVEWVFVEEIMRRLGFADDWIKLIMMCISTASYSVLINGEQCGFFQASRAVGERKITGVAASRGGLKISHLFFADDSLLFCQATMGNCEAVRGVLQFYEEVSGQKLNQAKTSIFFTKNTPMDMRQRIQGVFQYFYGGKVGASALLCLVKYCFSPCCVEVRNEVAYWGWHIRLFIVRSAYFLQAHQRAQSKEGECSGVGHGKKFWKFLWSLSLPKKVKVFMWKACLGILPTYDLLWHRHMRRDGICFCCKVDVESVSHVIWSCPMANDVWLQSGLSLHKWDRSIYSFFDLLVCAQKRLKLGDLQLFCCMDFFIWEQRNWVIHERGSYNPIAVVDRARNLRQSFHRKPTVKGPATGVVDDGVVVLRSDLPWVPPMEGWYKMNWAIFLGGVPRGYGAIIQALQFVVEMGFLDVVMEGLSVHYSLEPAGGA
uniref:Reverse transcriptase zinc-binding domain-containing protein n=1 Tax=Fagus sylvatica TaxID=28930 RepID=A0A2N9GZ45_FAGSY